MTNDTQKRAIGNNQLQEDKDDNELMQTSQLAVITMPVYDPLPLNSDKIVSNSPTPVQNIVLCSSELI